MSLNSGPAGGKGVDSNAVDAYDSGDEWDIGVGNLIIDLDADLEKDKLEMSGTKEAGGMVVPPSAVAALPDNIKFVSPVPTPQGKESKSKSKRSKNSKDGSKASAVDGAKKEPQGAAATAGMASAGVPGAGKGSEKSGKASRSTPAGKKDKEAGSAKSKKEKAEGAQGGVTGEKDTGAPQLTLGTARSAPFEATPCTDLAAAEPLGNAVLEPVGPVPLLAIKTEPEELDNVECRAVKKVKSEKVRPGPVFRDRSVHSCWLQPCRACIFFEYSHLLSISCRRRFSQIVCRVYNVKMVGVHKRKIIYSISPLA